MDNLPKNLVSFVRRIAEPGAAVDFAKEIGLIPERIVCPQCRNVLTGDLNLQARCRRVRQHASRRPFLQSLLFNTWFEKANISVAQILLITYSFAMKLTYEQCISQCSHSPNKQLSTETVRDWYGYCREVCMDALCTSQEGRGKIGGVGRTIEVEEWLIARRKKERGRVVEDQWVIGMMDRDSQEVRMEMCPNYQRDPETLLRVIQANVEPKSTILGDCLTGNASLEASDFRQPYVNNTNSVQSQWELIRRKFYKGIGQQHFGVHLAESLWRMECKRKDIQPFHQLLRDIKRLFPGRND